MKSFPIEGYRFFQHGNRVIAVSTYAGRTVRGVAVCASDDEFDLEYGKRLAAARCNAKVALKRRLRALNKAIEATAEYEKAEKHLHEMRQYWADAYDAYMDAETAVDQILAEKAGI